MFWSSIGGSLFLFSYFYFLNSEFVLFNALVLIVIFVLQTVQGSASLWYVVIQMEGLFCIARWQFEALLFNMNIAFI